MGANKMGDAEVFVIVEGLPQLECLRVASNFIGPKGALAIAENLPRLKKLDIGWNRIGTQGAVSIATKLILLEELQIGGNDIRGDGATAIARNLRNLKTLDIGSNQIGTSGAVEIGENLKALLSLNVSINEIGRQGLETQVANAIAKGLPQLKILDLSGNHIADAGLNAITEGLTRLEHLDISHNRLINVKTILSLLENRLLAKSRDLPGRVPLRHINVVQNPIRWPTNEAIDLTVLAEHDPSTLLRSLQAGPEPASVFVARAVLVGDGMHGKTHLALWLTGHPERFRPIPTGKEGRTQGFKPFEMTLKVILNSFDSEVDAVDVRLTLIDCGGQHEQLQSHHNLIYRGSDRTLFVLCLHSGKDFKKGNRADYYLRMLETFCQDRDRDKRVRVVIVVTHGDVPRRIDIPNEATLQRLYPNLRIRLADHYDSANGTNLEQVRGHIQEQLSTMSGLTQLVDSAVMRVREDIRSRFNDSDESNMAITDNPARLCPSIDSGEFTNICRRWHLDDDSGTSTLNSLCNLGDVVVPGMDHRIRSLPKDVVILNPYFVNRYINQIVTDEDTRRSKGFMKELKFEEFCKDLERFQREELRRLLRKHLVVFDWAIRTEAGVLIEGMLVPDLLPLRGDRFRERWNDASCGATVTFMKFLGEWRIFEMMAKHESMLQPLELSEEEAAVEPRPIGVFRDEFMVERGASRALIVTDVLEMKVEISVRGRNMDETCQFLRGIIADLVPLEEHGHVEIRQWENPSLRDKAEKASKDQLFIFRRTAKKAWEIAFGSEASITIRSHRQGFEYIAQLLSEPNRSIANIDLYARGNAEIIQEANNETMNMKIDKLGHDVILARIHSLEVECEKCDPGRRLEACEEIAALNLELKGFKRFNGRVRNLHNSIKKNAQNAVGNAILAALTELRNAGQHNLADHLTSHVNNSGNYSRCYLHEDAPCWVVSGWTIERPTE